MTQNINLASLTTAQGFAIWGGAKNDQSGYSVSDAGDFNKDGYNDIIIGARLASPNSRSNAGESYVIYGSATNLGTINLALALTSSQGFAILGGAANDQSGCSVSAAGDINNDGYADIIIGAYFASTSSKKNAGKSYVIYGSAVNPGTIDLSLSLSVTQGFSILGGTAGDYSGSSVSAAGDVNNDGYGDVIIGALYASPNSKSNAGESYVIYGSATSPGTIDLSSLTSLQGFAIWGGAADDQSGNSVSSAGDVNKDGYDDVIIGALYASPNSRGTAGESYIIYGSATNPGTINLALPLTSSKGFAVYGGAAGDQSGGSVSAAGDVNKDGYSDIVIGASYASPNSRANAGESYVIYGSAANPGTIDLSVGLTRLQGFAIWGGAAYDGSGGSVSAAGDINNDGYDDIIIGADYASPSSKTNAGKSYVIYGNATNLGTIDLSQAALTSSQGFSLSGGASGDYSGNSVSAAGDVNKDGYDDIIIGAFQASPSSKTNAGESYIIYGAASGFVTSSPTSSPVKSVTRSPTLSPTNTHIPTASPSYPATLTPTHSPTLAPIDTHIPTASPSYSATLRSTINPSLNPTSMPTQAIEITSGGIYNGTASNENFIINSSSDVTITGSGSGDMYTIEPNANTLITVTDFDNSSSIINLESFNIYNFDEVNITAGSIIITLEDNQIIKLLQLNPGDINADNFIFASSTPTPMPTLYSTSAELSSDGSSTLDSGEEAGIIIGGIAFLGAVGYAIYAYANNAWPCTLTESLASKAADHIGDAAL